MDVCSRFIQGVALVCLISLSIYIGKAISADAPEAAAEIISLKGIGEYKPDNIQTWRTAQIKQSLFPGNFVRTGAYSRMAILLQDKTQIRINQKSVLRLKDIQGSARSQGSTVLRLNRGRVWTQTRTLPRGLIMETPSATAAIRGTDWEIEVDNKGVSTITVLSGEVEYFNDFGRVVVHKNEQARAEPGKAPVKLLIIRPRDRVQWVTAYSVDPLRKIYLYSDKPEELKQSLDDAHEKSTVSLYKKGAILADMGRWDKADINFKAALEIDPGKTNAMIGRGYAALKKLDTDRAESFFSQVAINQENSELLRLGQIAIHIQNEKIGYAIAKLQKLITRTDLQQPAAFLLLSDLMLYSGDIDAAVSYAKAAMSRFTGSAQPHTQLARIYLLSGQSDESRKQVKQALDKDQNSYNAKIVQGDIARIEGDTGTAVNAYQGARDLSPGDDLAWHGLGLVNTEREEVKKARINLLAALKINPYGPGYYGEIGTLETFANNFTEADKAFQKALKDNPADYVTLTGLGIMHLKRGKTDKALNAFLRAGLLEPRYARAQIYTAIAYYQTGHVKQALQSLRQASELDDKDPMPHFLASIIYTDLLRPGEAITEARLALEKMPYLKSLNQLANDQRGSSNLGQAFAFMGMEDWAQHYAQESYSPFWAGSHLFLADRYNGLFTKNSELFQGFLSDPVVFGAGNRFQTLLPKPGHYFNGSLRVTEADSFDGNSPLIEVNGFDNSVFPIAYYIANERFNLNFSDGPYDPNTYTVALGAKPSHNFGAFVFSDRSKLNTGIDSVTSVATVDIDDVLNSDRSDIGFHYKFSPQSQLWFKRGRFSSNDEIIGLLNGLSISSDVDVVVPEYAMRHTLRFGKQYELTWGVERAKRTTDSLFIVEDTASSPGIFTVFDYKYSEISRDLYISGRYKFNDNFLLQADLFHQRHRRYALYDDLLFAPALSLLVPINSTRQDFEYSRVSPRFGFVYHFAPKRLLRFAYQKWVRPSSFSSLGPVSTAGIPLDDRFVKRGGELKRYRGQVEWELSDKTFATTWFDYKKINNNLFSLTPYTVNELESLGKLRSRDMGSLTRDELIEFVNTPDYEGGKIKSAAVSFNHILNPRWALFGTYIYTSSENTGTTYKDNKIPYLPRHATAAGVTWVSPRGWYFASRMVYRSERFSDEANTQRLQPGWDGAADLYWESKKKHLLLRFSVDDVFDKDQDTQYTAEVNFRY